MLPNSRQTGVPLPAGSIPAPRDLLRKEMVIVLKLCQVIDWDWVAVLSPILAGVCIVLMAILIGVILGAVKAIRKKHNK